MKTSPNAKIVADRLRRRAVALLHSSPRNRSSEVWDSLRKNPKRGVERHSAIVPRMNCGSAREWMEIADSCRQRAALYRSAIERAERPGGRASGPRWAKGDKRSIYGRLSGFPKAVAFWSACRLHALRSSSLPPLPVALGAFPRRGLEVPYPAWCSACLPSLWPPADRLDQAGRTGESGTRLRPSSIFVLPATSRYRKYLIRIFQIRDFTFAWQLLGHGGTILAFDGSRAEYYRQQAQRVRQLANSTRDSDIRYEYEQLADIYERLAAQADRGQIGR
jgi:hypothetical protein